MEENVTIYRPRKSIIGGGLVILVIVFFGLTLPLLIAGLPVPTQKLLGLGMFWLMGIALTILPLGFKLEVGDSYVKTYFFGIRIRKLNASDVQAVEYGNIFRLGGLGMGKGIKIWEKTSKGSKYFSIGESAYGEEAIAHAKRVMGGQIKG